jgi:hypothetical protein
VPEIEECAHAFLNRPLEGEWLYLRLNATLKIIAGVIYSVTAAYLTLLVKTTAQPLRTGLTSPRREHIGSRVRSTLR